MTTDRYVDRWGVRAFLAPVLAMILTMAAMLMQRSAWYGTLSPRQGQDQQSSPTFTLPASWMSGLQIDAVAAVPTNKWAALDLRLVDEAGNVLLDLVKEAWRERGTWREGNESGTYDESDQYLGWSVRLGQTEKVHLEARVLDMGDDTAEPGTVLSFTVPHDPRSAPEIPVTVSVRTRTVSLPLFLLAMFVSAGIATLAYHRAGHGGVLVAAEHRDGSEAQARCELGGPGRLVTVALSGALDSSAPENVEVTVRFGDGDGRIVHREVSGVETWGFGEDRSRRFWLHLHFELPRGTYQVSAQVGPRFVVRSLKMIVRDGNTTRGPVEVTQVGEAAA